MLHLVIGAIVISFAPILVKAMNLGPAAVGFYRTGIAGVILLAFCFHYRKDPRDNRSLILAGSFFAADMYCWNVSIQTIGAGMATIFANTQVFYLTAWQSWQEKRAPQLQLLLAVALGFGGIVLLLKDALSGDLSMTGVLAGALTGILYTGFILSFQVAQKKVNAPIVNLGILSVITAAWLSLPMSFEARNTIQSMDDLMLAVAYAVLIHIGGWRLLAQAMLTVPPAMIGLVLLLQPVLATVWGVLIYGESFTFIQALGAGAVFFGILLATLQKKNEGVLTESVADPH